MKRVLPVIVAALLLAGAFAALSWAAQGVENTSTNVYGSLKRSTYPLVTQGVVSSTTYAPGDSVNFTITGDGIPDAQNDVFDVQVFRAPGRTAADRITTLFYNDVALVNGRATVVFDGSQTKYLNDGTYYIGVYNQNYDTNGFTGTQRLVGGDTQFNVQLYYFSLQTQRRGFIPGETVSVSWSALNIRDSTPANGQNGAWLFSGSDSAGCSPLVIRQGTFTTGTGSVNMTFDNLANPLCTHSFTMWYNGTTDGGTRAGTAFYSNAVSTFSTSFWFLGHLRGSVFFSASPSSVPGAVATVTVNAYVQDPSFNQYPISGATVNLNFSRLDGSVKTYLSGPGGSFQTDGAGRASYAFLLNSPFTAGNTFVATANISKVLEMASPAPTSTFTVGQSTNAITTTLLLDRGGYRAGETASASVLAVAPPGGDTTFTYTFDVYLCTSSTCPQSGSFISEVDHVRTVTTTPAMIYAIRSGFSGYLKVVVYVSNQGGAYGTATQQVRVLSSDIVVSTDPVLYRPGDHITVSYESTLTSPTYFYAASYAAGGGYVVVAQGTTTATSFGFDVPQSGPPSQYQVTVYASSGSGTVVSQSVFPTLQGGVALEISFDKGSYAPGETVHMGFSLTPVGNSRVPESVVVSASIGGYSFSTRSLSPQGTLTFTLPSTLNQGDQQISASALDGASFATLAQASEVISVRGLGGNPLWFVRLADMPVVDWVLLGLVAILTIFGIKSGMIPFPGLHRAGKTAKAPKAPKGRSPPQTPPEQGGWGGPPP